jgi:hypothetical protein
MVVTGAASAQTACPQQAEIDAQEEQGRALRAAHRDAEALALFERAYGMCHLPRSLARVALAEGALGRWLDAETHLRDAMARRDDAWVSENRAALEGEAATIAQHLGDLEVVGTGDPAEVWIEGRRVGTWPTTRPLRVVAGSVTFTVRGDGYADVTRTVTVAPRGLARETVVRVRVGAVGGAGGATGERTARTEASGSTQRVVGWVLAGGAVAALGAGAVVSALRVSTYRGEFDPYFNNPVCNTNMRETDVVTCGGIYDTAARQASNGDGTWVAAQGISFGLGGALAVASVVVLATAPSSRTERPTALRCGPNLTTIGAGCTWSF